MNTLTYSNPFIPYSPPGKNVTKVVRLRKSRGKVYQDCDVYVGQAIHNSQWSFEESKFNNPFKKGNYEDLEKFRQYLLNDAGLMSDLQNLKGKRLGHFCHPRPCHADIIVDCILNPESTLEETHRKKVKAPCTKWDDLLLTGDRLVYYRGNSYLFSCDFPHNFCHEGHFFCSVLHAFHYERALRAKKPDLAQAILQARSTKKARLLAREIKLHLDSEIEIMLKLVDAKFDQLKEFAHEGKKYLFSFFMEVSANKKWGIGSKETEDSFQADVGLADFPGENIMGWINKFIITKRCRGAKGIQYLERFLAHAERTNQMFLY